MTARLTTTPGHFGELVQGRIGPDGPLALVTLPCNRFQAQVLWRPSRALRIYGVGPRPVRPAQLRKLAQALGVTPRGTFTVTGNMPLGGGAGASTAALAALAVSLAPDAARAEIANACLRVEGATDPLMFDRPEGLLWASRQAQVIDHLPPLPRFDVAGGFVGAPQRTRPTDLNFPDIGDLVDPLKRAFGAGDLPALAEIATTSARRCFSLRGPAGDPSEALLAQTGALGFVAAHTGSARGLLFAPGTMPADIRRQLLDAGLRRVVTFVAGGT